LLRNKPYMWVVLIAAVVFCLGYAGYRSLDAVPMTRTDALFGSLQLFVLESSIPPGSAPWSLEIARFMAPLTVAYATVLALAALLRDQFQWIAVRARASDHVVVIGLGRSNARLAAAMRKSGHEVVVVEANRQNSAIAGTRASGAKVVIGDATQLETLLRARVDRAAHVIVATGDDSRNLEIAEGIQESRANGPGGRRTLVHVAIDDLELWSELGRLHLGRARSGLILEFHSAADRAALLLVDTVEQIAGTKGLEHINLHGASATAERTLLHVVRRAVLAGLRPEIYVPPSTLDALAQLLARERWVSQAADLVTLADEHDVADGLAIVCPLGGSAPGVARGLSLAKSARCPHVFVAVDAQQSSAVLQAVGVSANLHIVRVDAEQFAPELLTQTGPELMARARHDDYVAVELARGVSLKQNPSLVPWEQLPESLRNSNRRFVDSIGEVVQRLGGWLVPLRALEQTKTSVVSDETLLDELAKKEHDRWMTDLRHDGWIFAPGDKDPQKKTHPALVEWDQLDEVAREKDRDAIRAIPRVLAKVGYAIELPHSR